MLRIGASLSAFQLRMIRRLSNVNQAIATSNLRLTTGKRINSAADDPSGIVAASQLRSELYATQQAGKNVDRSKALVDTADAALGDVVTHLTTIREQALSAAGGTLTQAEIDAGQADIDAAIEAINNITRTSHNGKRLLDGSQDFRTTGVDTAQVEQLTVHGRDTSTTSQTIDLNVTVDAQQATLTHSTGGGTIANNATFTLTGNNGTSTISVTSGEQITAVRDRVNQDSGLTGVTASVNGNDLVFSSTGHGSKSSAAVQVSSGTFAVTGGNGNGTANGVDAQATINGSNYTADGLKFRYRASNLKFDVELESSLGTGALNTITVSGDGLSFQIDPSLGQPAVLSLQSIHSALLGGQTGRLSEASTGSGKSLYDTGGAAAIVAITDEALAQVQHQQARVGSFSKQILGSAGSMLANQEANMAEALSSIEDADAALETALVVQNQLLADNIASALAIATSQQAGAVSLLQQLALRF